MNLTRNQMIIIGIGFLIVAAIVLLFLGVIPGLSTPASQNPSVKLTAWGIEDESSFQTLIDGYEKIRPNVKIAYTKIPEGTYEASLISALAAGRGPDIFMLKNTWLFKHFDKIAPAPSSQFTATELEQFFPRVAEQDFVLAGKIYALPLYIDTLALIYNKDIFDTKSIALPPKTWQEFQNFISQLREENSQNQITKAAAAIGGSETSIDRASDLLNNIFLQFGNPTISSDGGVRFDDNGSNAFNFYIQFVNPASPYYTWSDSLPYSIDSFSNGKTAMIFNYSQAIPAIKSKNPFLNIGVTEMPQFAGVNQPVNNASYWGLSVSRQSPSWTWAWDFIINTTGNSDIAGSYLQTSHKPPALRVLISRYLNDPELGVFAKQALTARSWHEPGGDTATLDARTAHTRPHSTRRRLEV